MLTRGFANLRHMTPVMGIAAVLGVNWALLSLLTAIIPPLFIVIGLLSGPMAAVYGTMLYLSRGVTPITSLGGTLLALTGILHIGWVPVTADLIQGALPQPLVGTLELAGLVAATGLVFAVVIAFITVSWRALLAMLAGTSLAIACEVGLSVLAPGAVLSLGIAILHLTIVATLLFTTLATIAERDLPGSCKSCGYDLAGNVGGVCPECGFDGLRRAPHPFDLEATGGRPRD